MEFPKDPAPTREEMINTYLKTLAKVIGRLLGSLIFFCINTLKSLKKVIALCVLLYGVVSLVVIRICSELYMMID